MRGPAPKADCAGRREVGEHAAELDRERLDVTDRHERRVGSEHVAHAAGVRRDQRARRARRPQPRRGRSPRGARAARRRRSPRTRRAARRVGPHRAAPARRLGSGTAARRRACPPVPPGGRARDPRRGCAGAPACPAARRGDEVGEALLGDQAAEREHPRHAVAGDALGVGEGLQPVGRQRHRVHRVGDDPGRALQPVAEIRGRDLDPRRARPAPSAPGPQPRTPLDQAHVRPVQVRHDRHGDRRQPRDHHAGHPPVHVHDVRVTGPHQPPHRRRRPAEQRRPGSPARSPAAPGGASRRGTPGPPAPPARSAPSAPARPRPHPARAAPRRAARPRPPRALPPAAPAPSRAGRARTRRPRGAGRRA